MNPITVVDWFGTMAGLFGVFAAVYLQLLNPRAVRPLHVLALFGAGAALVLTFSAAWNPYDALVVGGKVVAILVWGALEVVGAWLVWTHAEPAPPREVLASLWDGNHG